MRLFLGTMLEKHLLDKLPFKEIQSAFNDSLKPIKRNNIHITWAFFGEVEKDKLNKLNSLISKNIDLFKSLEFHSEKLELWPLKTPRIIVIKGNLYRENKLIELDLNGFYSSLSKISNVDIKKRFIPHITIGRIKDNLTTSQIKHISLPGLNSFIWKIKEVSFIKSVLSDKGSIYTIEKNWKVKL